MSGFSCAEVLGVDRVLANPPESVADDPRAARAGAGRRDGRAGDAAAAARRPALRTGTARRADPAPRRAACAVHRPRHQRRQRAERALRDSEEQYRAIFNASADGLVLRDADYRAVDVNPAYLAMSGYTREEVLSASGC